MGLFNFLLGSGDEDLSVLPDTLISTYKDPFVILGIDRGTKTEHIQDRFRALMAAQNTEYVGYPIQKYSFKQILLAFRLIMNELPASQEKGGALELSKQLTTNKLFAGAEPDHFVTWLRPLHCAGLRVPKTVRACRALHLTYLGPEGFGPGIEYRFTVSYCMRITEIRKRYSHFDQLHQELAKEVLILPGFPEKSLLLGLGLGSKKDRGERLAEYVNLVHECLAARGAFSPRLLQFLELDYARVQYEEEGRTVVHVLDTQGLMQGSQWQIIEAKWLERWRKFIQSRGARRYQPPGPIDNQKLVQDLERSKVKGSKVKPPQPAKDYRAVNFNVWWYLFKIYGGGPEITRKTRYIQDAPTMGRLQALYKIQSAIRGYLARRTYTREYLTRLAATAPGVREVLYTRKQNALVDAAQASIQAAQQERTLRQLAEAARFTQSAWRQRKAYGQGEDELKVRKHIQEVFARVAGSVEEAAGGMPLVVREEKGIVTFGSSEEYECVIRAPTEGNKLPIKFSKQKNSEISYVRHVDRNLEQVDDVKMASVLLAINGYPVSSLTHADKMQRLGAARFPITLKLRRPLEALDVLQLYKIFDIESEEIRLQELKRRLFRGVTVIKHCRGNSLKKPVPHKTRLSIDEHRLYWEGRDRDDKSKDTHKTISLFQLEWCKEATAKRSKVFKNLKGSVHESSEEILKRCFTIGIGKRTLDFEVQAEDGNGEKRCQLLVWGFQKIIKEIKGAQLYVDKEGNAIKRKNAKRQLKTMS
mmetsp:Transcript_9340/g.15671  ORF Transcript_9340/g.15671 Transcript_9340/m.15671 type:complete len:758 (+) Transcript_9340:128-2401(+)